MVDQYEPLGQDDSSAVLTLEEAAVFLGFGAFQWRFVLICGFPFMADAMEIILISFIGSIVQNDLHASETEASTVTAMIFVGMLLGSTFWGIVSDRWGRRYSFWISVGVTLLGGLMSAGAQSFLQLGLCRMVVGFGSAAAHVASAIMTEFVPTAKRASCGTALLAFWTVGVVLEAVVAWLIIDRLQLHWRWLFLATALPFGLLLLFIPFVPESPRFLLQRGSHEAALDVMRSVALVNGKEWKEGWALQVESETEVPACSSVLGHVLRGTQRRVSLSLLSLWVCCSTVYYGVVLLTDKAAPEGGVYATTIYSALFEIPAYPLLVALSETLGRRWCAALMAMATSLLIASSGFVSNKTLRLVLMGSSRLAVITMFDLLFVFTPELYPTEVRSTMFGLCVAVSRLGGITAPFLIQWTDSPTWLCPTVLAGVCILGVVASLTIPVETKGRILDSRE
eukprot:TRINITY_DN17044_c0_g1_i4.p1 TRINITY_DN17044_c0_g1~~TRINITY_DN17044_c0_g1_i4.p1  ORF type:complete len:452 (-),score=74.66 TRINITY_DN17044_c0_g1_i4:460-1815(-)